MEIQSEQAFEFLIQHLAQIPPNIQRHSLAALRYAHLYLPDIVPRFWQTRTSGTPTVDLTDEQYAVFYDAAWELARIGVLRPGRVAPRNMEQPNDFGDHWSITKFGFDWLARTSSRPFLDMSRMSEVLAGFVPAFGPGFGQNHRAFAEVERVMKMENGATFGEFVVLRALRAKGRGSPLLRTVKDRVARCRATSWPHAAAAVAPETQAAEYPAARADADRCALRPESSPLVHGAHRPRAPSARIAVLSSGPGFRSASAVDS